MVLKVGIDFDNTLANYSGVFYRVALELDLIPPHLGQTKSEVKQYFFNANNREAWTELQGIVYGKQIGRAKLYANAMTVIKALLHSGADVYIVSHKTKYPVIGEKDSLHRYALNWLRQNSIVGTGEGLINESRVFFNETQQDKIQKLSDLDCDYFIDDLPAIFEHKDFSGDVTKIFFDPDGHYTEAPFAHYKASSWLDIGEYLNVS